MNEFEDLTSRLKALGDNPVPPPVATQHLTAMAEVAAPRTRFAHKVRVAAAFGIGLLVGGTGLGYAAAEGHLPDAAQNGLSVAAEKVGVELPRGDEKKADKADNEGNGGDNSSTPLSVPACGDEENHGEFVSSNVRDAREAGTKGNARDLAKSDCGKDGTEEEEVPEGSDTGDDGDDDGDEGKAKGAAKKAENAPDEADPAGPPSEQPPVTPPADGDDEDEAADDAGDPAGPPSSVPPVSTPDNGDAGDDSED